jgi:DNA polymerase-4
MAVGAPTLVGHVDLDAFFAAIEQRDKPSLRGRPVVVGGVGPRGVVATASYEARVFGIHSAMPMAEARRRCPHAAVLAGRFDAYRLASRTVMQVLAEHSPQVEQVSLDEAYLTLPAPDPGPVIDALRQGVVAATGLRASVGCGPSKLVAKIASDAAKPDGVLLVPLEGVQAFLDPLPVRRIPGVGPASGARLARLGVGSVHQLRQLSRAEVAGLLGEAHGTALWQLAHGDDPRVVEPAHEVKSVSVEETFDHDLTDPARVQAVLERMAGAVAGRLRGARTSGRTVTLKARYPDFTTLTRSATHAGPTDDARTIARTAQGLLADVDLARGLRLLGVGVSGLAPWVQTDLFEGELDDASGEQDLDAVGMAGADGGRTSHPVAAGSPAAHRWRPGQDVRHATLGPGWVWGAGLGRVTVRFETRDTPPGPVRTFAADDPALEPAPPLLSDDEGEPPPRPAAGPPLLPAGR